MHKSWWRNILARLKRIQSSRVVGGAGWIWRRVCVLFSGANTTCYNYSISSLFINMRFACSICSICIWENEWTILGSYAWLSDKQTKRFVVKRIWIVVNVLLLKNGTLSSTYIIISLDWCIFLANTSLRYYVGAPRKMYNWNLVHYVLIVMILFRFPRLFNKCVTVKLWTSLIYTRNVHCFF